MSVETLALYEGRCSATFHILIWGIFEVSDQYSLLHIQLYADDFKKTNPNDLAPYRLFK